MKMRKLTVAASLLLFGAAGCDLAVDNTEAPDQRRALANPGDVEALIGGAWWSWYNGWHNFNFSPSFWLSTAAFQHSAYPANFGMVHYSSIPRVPTTNATSHDFYPQLTGTWTNSYRAVAAVNDGLRALNTGVDLGANATRARAFAKFVQGVGHGTVAMLYPEGPIVDETSNLEVEQPFQDYNALLAAALGYLDEAIALANQGFATPIPYDWMIVEGSGVTGPQLARMASSYKAMFRAAVPRTPAEAANVNWNSVLSEVNAGVTEDVRFRLDGGTRWLSTHYYGLAFGWSQMNYFIHGMADQSGQYQEWMALPHGQKHPDLASGPFLINTPDTRFPQGATVAQQAADARPGSVQRFRMPPNFGDQWGRADRGTWRWSYYRDWRNHNHGDVGTTVRYIHHREQRLLAAEAHYRLGNLGQAAAIVNESRTAAGLNATDAAGTNTSCVPKLPNGSCGDLLEMIKWERRMNAHEGDYVGASMYFDSRRWGDLMEGTILTIPVPCRDAQLEGMECRDFGGPGGEFGAPRGTYGY
jgi:hypothetical protein